MTPVPSRNHKLLVFEHEFSTHHMIGSIYGIYYIFYQGIIIIIITVQTSIMSMMYKVIYLFILTNKFLNSSIVLTVDKLSGRLFHSLIADGKKEYL